MVTFHLLASCVQGFVRSTAEFELSTRLQSDGCPVPRQRNDGATRLLALLGKALIFEPCKDCQDAAFALIGDRRATGQQDPEFLCLDADSDLVPRFLG